MQPEGTGAPTLRVRRHRDGRGRQEAGRKGKHWGVVSLLCHWDEAMEGTPTELHRVLSFSVHPFPYVHTALTYFVFRATDEAKLDFYCLSFTFAGCRGTLCRHSRNRTQPGTRKQRCGPWPSQTSGSIGGDAHSDKNSAVR